MLSMRPLSAISDASSSAHRRQRTKIRRLRHRFLLDSAPNGPEQLDGDLRTDKAAVWSEPRQRAFSSTTARRS
jgi:hypothetical protein